VIPDLRTLKRERDLALAHARHAWDYERRRFPGWRERARLCQARVDLAEAIAKNPLLAHGVGICDFDDAARVLESDIPADWPRYEP
jgi:hypothetical protein